MTKPGVMSIQVNNNELVWNQKNGKKEGESIQELENLVNSRTEELSSMIKELLTPVKK
ncbi:hypothetical protein QUF79_09480 [Fictibacillus enclensis]|uniref:hypothetical protein n=1 Tax=Fictibacillus enclensis TaxID=1017270 RepID=UPI0025A278DC|nr:hypothetical protein [Fictibacillus enclensis]MDM5198246.1 hypothetical protein [Fictibacillus enclensis]